MLYVLSALLSSSLYPAQARILGHIDLLKDKRGDDEDDEDEPNDTPQDTVPVAPAGRRNTISHADASAAENLVLLKSRVWELFWDDAVLVIVAQAKPEGNPFTYVLGICVCIYVCESTCMYVHECIGSFTNNSIVC